MAKTILAKKRVVEVAFNRGPILFSPHVEAYSRPDS
jgi:hypothetical protein